MSLARLLAELRPLLQDPKNNFETIVDLLDAHDSMAEYEVARVYASKALAKNTAAYLRSRDPQRRMRALRAIGMTFPRAEAAKLLRRVVKDPDFSVRAHARAIVRKLELTDVALPDTRIELQPWMSDHHTTPGYWNPTGWALGTLLYRLEHPTRPALLAQNGLPVLQNEREVAALVGLSPARLPAMMRPGVGPGSPYVEFEIDKRGGGQRTITAPRASLKSVQRAILEKILAQVPVHDAAHGFVAGRSVVTNAEPHQRARVLVKMDLLDFFPTVHFRRVEGMFQSIGYGASVARTLASLCTHRPRDGRRVIWPGVLPQGAPTSPAISNLICRRMDRRLAGLAAKAGGRYTRYADDLTFSFAASVPDNLGKFCWWVDQICQQEGFYENTKKRRILRNCNQQRVTGVVVNSGLFVPRAARRRFRATLHNVRKNGVEQERRGHGDFEGYLRGFAAYVKMVQPALGQKLTQEVEEVLGG